MSLQKLFGTIFGRLFGSRLNCHPVVTLKSSLRFADSLLGVDALEKGDAAQEDDQDGQREFALLPDVCGLGRDHAHPKPAYSQEDQY